MTQARSHKLSASSKGAKKPLSLRLVLPGGGAYGAFAAGAICRIAQDPDIQITEIFGTSAGALNGGAYAVNGCEGVLSLWKDVARYGDRSIYSPLGFAKTFQNMVAGEGLSNLIKKHSVSPLALSTSNISLNVYTVSKIDPKGAFKNENLQAHSHSNRDEGFRRKHIVASARLKEFSGLNVNGITLYDGAYIKGNNPNTTTILESDCKDPVLILSVDQIKPYMSEHGIPYGHIFKQARELKRKGNFPVYHRGLQTTLNKDFKLLRKHERDDQERGRPSTTLIKTLMNSGAIQANMFLQDIRADYGLPPLEIDLQAHSIA